MWTWQSSAIGRGSSRLKVEKKGKRGGWRQLERENRSAWHQSWAVGRGGGSGPGGLLLLLVHKHQVLYLCSIVYPVCLTDIKNPLFKGDT